jgi:hypothetical protein
VDPLRSSKQSSSMTPWRQSRSVSTTTGNGGADRPSSPSEC